MQRTTMMLGAGALVLGAAGDATAGGTPTCESLGLPNPVYAQVGDTQDPLMRNLGKRLRDDATNPITLVYFTTGSCTNIEQMYTNTPLAAGLTMKYIPADYDPTTPPPNCTLDGDGELLDIANSALFNSACDPSTPPAGVVVENGPIQAYVFAVPEASTQTAITAEEAYFVFGFGDLGMAQPWTNELNLHIRTPTKSTLLALAAAIGVPGAMWQGVMHDASNQVVAALRASTAPEETIGILGAEIYDRNRADLDALAFQAFGQWYAYYPDSTAAAEDKRNVRDGHYVPWSPTVWMTRPASPSATDARFVVDLILGRAEADGYDPLEIEIDLGLVPVCAMFVTREYEGGPLSPYESPEPCHCFYDSVKGETPSCEPCGTDGSCAAGSTCRHGYCEPE